MRVDRDQREMDVAMGLGAPEEPIDVSVILPAYNETGTICGVHEQVTGVLQRQDVSYEIIFVDDGSTDDTWHQIELLAERDLHVRGLKHRRNFGKASALANGFTFARGEVVVTSDADMQYDPNDIIRLIDKLNEGWDVVSAYKVVRRDPLSKRLPSKFFNYFVRTTTGVQLHDVNAGLKAYRHEAADDMVRYGYGELHRFFIILAAKRGYTVTEVPVESQPREKGSSKYGAERYMRGAFDFLTVYFLSGYGERPLHLFGGAGILLGAIGIAIFGYLGVVALMGLSLAGRPLIDIAMLLLLAGMQLVVVGLVAEMINNLERGSSSRSKISRVLRVERRTAVVLSPGIKVERRRRATDPEYIETLHEGETSHEPVVRIAPGNVQALKTADRVDRPEQTFVAEVAVSDEE
jgi:dolichol-phosphate mannosyltransferase